MRFFCGAAVLFALIKIWGQKELPPHFPSKITFLLEISLENNLKDPINPESLYSDLISA